METLTDLRIFDNRTGVITRKNGRCITRESGTGQQAEYFGRCTHPLLNCRFFCRTVCTGKGFFQHRAFQSMVSADYVLKGTCCFRSGNAAVRAAAGDVVILPYGGDNYILCEPQKDCCIRYGIAFDGSLLPHLLEQYQLTGFAALHVGNMRSFRLVFEKLQHAMQEHEPDETVSGILFEMLALLGKYQQNRELPASVWTAADYMEKHLAEKVQMSDVAAAAGDSMQNLKRHFVRHFRATPYRYLISRRMTMARSLLEETDLRIKEIALRTGYEDPLYFSSEFTRFFGLSPRAYRHNSCGKNPQKRH